MKKTALVLALVGATGYGAYRWISSDDARPAATTDGEQLVLDRIWIDHMPKNDRDTIQFFAAITEEPFGVFQAASSWKGQYELFRYQASGNELRIVYPQTNERERHAHEVGGDQDALAIVAIGDHAGDRRREEDRQDRCRIDERGRARTARQARDEIGDRDEREPVAGERDDRREEESAKVAVLSQQRARGHRRGYRSITPTRAIR